MVTLKAKNRAEKENVALLELAVSCRLITREQERQILQEILENTRGKTKISVARVLYQHKILEKDQIEFLFAVKKHIDMLVLDKKFGRLGVANEFVCQEKIDKALTIQIDIFKKQKKSVKIGDILVHKKEISEADKIAILLTQDRIRDDYLADALNAIAKNEMERTAINKRFGAIAVKKKLITTDQLNQALTAQKKETKEKGGKRYLGEFLRELFDLSEKDTAAILKIQKKLETKRMNLQKKVFEFNAEKESVKTLDQFLELQVSEDKLAAFVIQKKGTAMKIDNSDVVNWLANAGIKYGVCTEKEIQAVFKSLETGKKYKIAQGRAPIEAKKEQVTFAFDPHFESEDGRKEPTGEVRVKKNAVIATVIPFEEGIPGRDVFGHPIDIDPDDMVKLSNGEGVIRRGNDFIALIDGIPRVYKNRTVFVTPIEMEVETREIEGDITEKTQGAFPDCNLNVSGNILPGATVSCNRLTVKGDALGNISAAGDVEIQGNIGDVKDVETAQPSIQINTRGCLTVNGKHICARIVTDKGVTAPHADIVNSRIFSSGDVIVKNIQSGKESPTVIRVAMKHIVELQKLKKMIDQEQNKLDELTCKSEMDSLTKKLMGQAQVQQGYLENQTVLTYLMKVMAHAEFKELGSIKTKISAYEEKLKTEAQGERQETVSKDTKAYKFLKKIVNKLETIDQKDQDRYVKEFYDNITGMLKAAVNATDRFNKKYEARCKQVDAHIKKHKEKIVQKKQAIRDLLSRRDYLKLVSEKEENNDQLMIKVKNSLAEHTVIKGNEAHLLIEKTVHGVFIRESPATQQKEAEMLVQGSFE